MPHLFISYSRADLTFVERLAADLKSAGFDVWYDVSNLGGGSRWNKAIEQAIRDSEYMVVVLTPDSVSSQWVDDEVSFARTLKKKIVPLYYRQCDLGLMYVNLNWIDIRGGKYKSKHEEILSALDLPNSNQGDISKSRIKQDSFILSNGMEFLRVPFGEFIIGSNKNEDIEKPEYTAEIPYDYWMGRYPVTNEQYSVYAGTKEIDHPVDDWKSKKDHPVVSVNWNTVAGYIKWLNDSLKSELALDLVLRLPIESEWEKAARGTDGREYPWGNKFDSNKCNIDSSLDNIFSPSATTSVYKYSPQGDSPYGCADMVGNVREWTYSEYKPYNPLIKIEKCDVIQKDVNRMVRGGAYFCDKLQLRCSSRFRLNLYDWSTSVGFRLVLAPPIADIISGKFD